MPKFFLIENVKGLLDEKFKDVFEDFLSRLDEIGYDVKYRLLDAVDYEVCRSPSCPGEYGFRSRSTILGRSPKWTVHVVSPDLAFTTSQSASPVDTVPPPSTTDIAPHHDGMRNRTFPAEFRLTLTTMSSLTG